MFYYTLRLLNKMVTCDEAPRIPELDAELEGNFQWQDRVEDTKLKAVTLEQQERIAQVAWFSDPKSHSDMLD